MLRLEALLEQTAFLLDKQKEAKEESSKIFSDLLSFFEEKLDHVSGDEKKEIEKTHDLLSGHSQSMVDEMQGDIDFLGQQLHALQEIKKIGDPEKEKELLSSLLDEDEEILDTEEFKKDLIDEAALSRRNLIAMVDDVKQMINEGKAQDVALLIEAMLQEEEPGSDPSDACSGCEPKSCGGCVENNPEGQECDGVDIFSGVNKDQ